METPKLIFVYNANSGIVNTYLDIAHKILSPSTYQCNLCDLTHGVFKERSTWKIFRENFHLPMEFLHIDEFKNKYNSLVNQNITYPIVFIHQQTGISEFINTSVLNALKTEDELQALIVKKAAAII